MNAEIDDQDLLEFARLEKRRVTRFSQFITEKVKGIFS